MDSNVQTKSPNNRRTKYIIVGLIAVICVLSYQLYKESTIKKELVSRKSFLIGKLYECRVASEKTDTKYKDKRAQNEKLTKDLAATTADYKQISKKYDELETSYESKTEELQRLQQSAGQSKNQLSALKENYGNAMSSVKTMQGKLDDTIRVCEQHKENSRSLNMTTAQRTRELETCKQEKASLEQEKASLEQEKEVLVASEQDLRKKIEEMGQTKSVRSVDDNTGGSQVQQPQEPLNVVKSQSPIVGKVKRTEYVHSQSTQNPALPAQSTQDQTSLTQGTQYSKQVIRVTSSLKQPTTKQTMESFLRNKDVIEITPPASDDSLI